MPDPCVARSVARPGSRVRPGPESTVPEIADIILRTGDETDVDHVVDLVHLADQGVDQALELPRQTMEPSRGKPSRRTARSAPGAASSRRSPARG